VKFIQATAKCFIAYLLRADFKFSTTCTLQCTIIVPLNSMRCCH